MNSTETETQPLNQHTPGPWSIDHCTPETSEGASYALTLVVENKESHIASATDGSLLHDGTTPINKADAIAKRLNWDGISYLENDCPEFVP